MQTITTIGLDIAKSVFQVHGIDAEGDPPDISILFFHRQLGRIDRQTKCVRSTDVGCLSTPAYGLALPERCDKALQVR
jgi:hypothetical protein